MASFASFLTDTQAAVYARATQAPARTLFQTYQATTVTVTGVVAQRIEGGSGMSYKRNVAAKVPFKAVDLTGAGYTGLSITAKTGKDGANPTTATNAVTESGQGWYYITLTSTEMDGEIVVLDASAGGATIAPVVIHTEADYTVARAAKIDNLDATVSSRSTYAGGAVASVTAAVTVGTNNDKTGYSLSAAGVQAIWDALTSALTTVGSIGKWIVDKLDVVLSTRLASSGYTAPLDAAGTRAAVGLASANLDTQFTNVPTAVRTNLATELGRIDVATSTRLASAGYTAPDNAGIATAASAAASAAVSASSAASAAASAATDAASAASDAAAIKAKTDSLAFTVAGKVDANIRAVNDISIAGAGVDGTDPWRAA